MWSRRAQEYDQKINSGKIYELAEVVKDLNKNTDIIFTETNNYCQEVLFIIVLQYLSYKIAVLKNINPDKPKNLAKVVTVE